MTILVLIVAFLVYKIISSAVSAKKEHDREKEIASIKREQELRKVEYQQQKIEYQRQYAEAKAWTQRQIALEKEQQRQAKEQQRVREAFEKEKKERAEAEAKIIKEQERQAAQLAKHEEMIAKLEYTISKAVKDIEDLTDELGKKYALLDIAQNQQMMAVPGSKADESAQKKILSYEKSIRTLENKINKAKFDKEQAERKISA